MATPDNNDSVNDSAGAGERVEARRGFFPLVVGDEVTVAQGGGRVFLAGKDLTVKQGGGQYLMCGGSMRITQGGGAVLAAREATVQGGFVGLVLAQEAKLEDDVQVLMGTRQAAAFGIAAALVLLLLRKLFRH